MDKALNAVSNFIVLHYRSDNVQLSSWIHFSRLVVDPLHERYYISFVILWTQRRKKNWSVTEPIIVAGASSSFLIYGNVRQYKLHNRIPISFLNRSLRHRCNSWSVLQGFYCGRIWSFTLPFSMIMRTCQATLHCAPQFLCVSSPA